MLFSWSRLVSQDDWISTKKFKPQTFVKKGMSMNMKIISTAFSSKIFPTIQGNLQLLLKVFFKINQTPI